jgi:RNA polymerase sigma-70 factor (ECF subfamily)
MSREDHSRFPTTSWTLVWSAGGTESEATAAALGRLCEAYWFPLYHYVRRLGHPEQDAADLVQGFLLSLISRRRLLKGVSGNRSLFRTYVKAALRYHLSDQWRRDNSQRAGGAAVLVPLEIELEGGERRFIAEPLAALSPDMAYEKLWALAMLDRALTRLRVSFEERGARAQFESLLPCLEGDPDDRPYDEIATALGVSVNAARVAASRFRKSYERCVLDEISDTVSHPDDVPVELANLRAALSTPDL